MAESLTQQVDNIDPKKTRFGMEDFFAVGNNNPRVQFHVGHAKCFYPVP